jgi:hypothetical protein
MKWSDLPLNPTAKVLRQFAAGWLVCFLGLAAHQYWVRGHPRAGLALGVLAIVFGGMGLIKPASLRRLFVGWMVVAFPIGWLISQAALLLMFFGLITPLALLFRIRGRDLLARKPAPERPSFWAPKHTPSDVCSYFRQY